MIWVLAQHELRRLFYSPLAWSILGLIQLILAMVFLSEVQNYLGQIQAAQVDKPGAVGVTSLIVAPLYFWAGIVLLIVMPLLTMRSFSEECQLGTLPLLLSAPISMVELVLGKYLGLLGLLVPMIIGISMMPLSLAIGTHLDWGHLAAVILGLFLLTGSFVAAGIFISSLVSEPVLAAVGSFGLLAFLWVLYLAGSAAGAGSLVFVQISNFSHFLPFLRGEFDSSAVIYYLLFTLVFLALTVLRLDSQRLPH